MPPAISVVVSTLALTISMVTAWLTLFRRGTVRMTRPTAIYFGADGSVDSSPKVYLRTLLYSTAKCGQIGERGGGRSETVSFPSPAPHIDSPCD